MAQWQPFQTFFIMVVPSCEFAENKLFFIPIHQMAPVYCVSYLCALQRCVIYWLPVVKHLLLLTAGGAPPLHWTTSELEDKREDYQNCSVLYCVPQLCTVISTLIRAVLQMNCFRCRFCVCVCDYTRASLFVIGLVFVFCIFSLCCCFVVSTSAIDCL